MIVRLKPHHHQQSNKLRVVQSTTATTLVPLRKNLFAIILFITVISTRFITQTDAFAPRLTRTATRTSHYHPHHRWSSIASFSNRCLTSTTTTTTTRSSSSTIRMSSVQIQITNDTVQHINEEELPIWMMPERTRLLSKTQPSFGNKQLETTEGSIIYWMQRDVRTVDNWALLMAAHYAKVTGLPLRVLYTLPPPPQTPIVASSSSSEVGALPPSLQDMPMTQRHGSFLLGGLEEVQKELKEVDVPLHVLMPESDDQVGAAVDEFVAEYKAKLVVCDFSPLRQFRQWHELQALPLLEKRKGLPFVQVDAHNVVPVWHASPKREVGARTLRSKINKVVSDFIAQGFPELEGNQHLSKDQTESLEIDGEKFERKKYETSLKMDRAVETCDWAKPGTKGAMEQFKFFVEEGGLKRYDEKRNDPNEAKVCSDMSPWLNHGHVAFQTLLLKAKKINKYATGVASFVEEGLIRKELSDNYVYYTPNDYDTLEAAAGWAKETLVAHTTDEREYLYSFDEFEQGKTHDELWNAAQLQVVREGRMHGFMRMYWCKKY